jgi:predicted DsbA family dithiol-disulfide isomerase
VTVDWVPFELHPEIPAEGFPRDLAFPPAYRQQAEAGMQRLAAQVGLTLRSHDRLINSRPTLQAAEFARETGHFRSMHHELFKAYWDEQRDVSDLEVLREVGGRIGLDVEAMTEAVTADRYGPLLDARRQEAEDLMISGIPAHVVAERYLVMGAQPYDVFERLMGRLGVPKK